MKALTFFILIFAISCKPYEYDDLTISIINVDEATIKLYSNNELILTRDFDRNHEENIHLSKLKNTKYKLEASTGKTKKVIEFVYPKTNKILVEM